MKNITYKKLKNVATEYLEGEIDGIFSAYLLDEGKAPDCLTNANINQIVELVNEKIDMYDILQECFDNHVKYEWEAAIAVDEYTHSRSRELLELISNLVHEYGATYADANCIFLLAHYVLVGLELPRNISDYVDVRSLIRSKLKF